MYYVDEQDLTRAEKTKKREDEILTIIINFYSKHHYPPTVREIKILSPFQSTSTVFQYLKRLKLRGVIEWKEKSPRSIRILEDNKAEKMPS